MSLSTDCRIAGLVAFSQARAMGTGTNAGGGALAGGADCGRDPDGKFGSGNKCRWSGSTPDGKWEIEDNTAGTTMRIDAEPAPHVLRLKGSDGKVKAFMHATVIDDASPMKLHVDYSQVVDEEQGKGVYTNLLNSLSEQFTVLSDSPPNLAIPAAKAYKKLGAEKQWDDSYILHKKPGRSTRAFCPTGSGGGVDNSCGISNSQGERIRNVRTKSDKVQTKVARKLYQMRTTEKQIKKLIRDLGGKVSNSIVEIDSTRGDEGVNIFIRDRDNNETHFIHMGYYGATIYTSDKVSDREAKQIKGFAKEAFPKTIAKRLFAGGKKYDIEVVNDPNQTKKSWDGLSSKQRLKAKLGARYASLLAFAESRAFCPTGEGGGIDNSCGGNSATTASFPSGSKKFRDAVDAVSPDPAAIWDRARGLAETPPARKVDEIAAEQAGHSGPSLTPEAEASYAALVNEIGRQYESLTASGLRVRAWRGEGEPYAEPAGSTKPNSNKMREEVARTGEFNFFMTEKGFGTGDATPGHPMLRETKYRTADGEPMIANDLFRVVHDMVAHIRGGYSFSTNGEFNGMLTHASTLTEEAWPALFAETFGQNAVYEKTKQYAPQNAYASKIGPAVIREELKKRAKSTRAAAVDSDEPLGYQHIKSRPGLLAAVMRDSLSRRSLDARYASLLAFAESRGCGRDEDGKFSSGNTCASGVAAAAASGAVKGGIKGAITGLLAGGPAVVKPAAAIGAATGAVKGIYDNQMRPTRVKKTIEKLGMDTKQVGELVQKLGGTPESSADTEGSKLQITIRNKEGKKSFHVEVSKDTVTVYPRRATGELTSKEISRVKEIADKSTPKAISVVVKKGSSAYVSKLVRNGFTLVAGHAADVLVATYLTAPVHSFAHDAVQTVKGKFSRR